MKVEPFANFIEVLTKTVVMKTKITFWTRLSFAVAFVISSAYLSLVSCEKEKIQPTQIQSVKSDLDPTEELMPLPIICGEMEQRDLLIDNKIKVGDIYISNDRNNLYVYVVAIKGRLLKSAYLFTGLKENIPFAHGNVPDVARFSFVEESEEFVRMKRFIIPQSALQNRFTMSLMVETKGNIASHEYDGQDGIEANESGREYYNRAWAQGDVFGYLNQGKLFTYSMKFCGADVSNSRSN